MSLVLLPLPPLPYSVLNLITPTSLSPLWISLKTAIAATIYAVFMGTAAARWMLSYRGRGKGLIDGIFTLPLVLPPTVVGFLLLLLLGRNSPVGQLLQQLGLSVVFTPTAAVIASTVVAFPLMYKTTLSAFEQVDSDLLNCARTLGVSEWKLFWQVLLPLARSGVVAGTILAFARALGEFGATLMVAGSIPGKTQTMPIALFFEAEAGRIDQASNWVLIMVAISLAVITAINYWSGDRRSQTNYSKANQFIRRLTDFWLFGEVNLPFKKSLFKRDRPKRSPPQTSELLVKVRKDLPGFTLQTNFTAGEQPLGLLGASGSGKSMTLRCIAGLETPSEGRIVLNGRVLFDSQRQINVPPRDRRIGFLFQNYALFPHLTVAQNIAFGLQDLSQTERTRRVAHYLEMMQLQGTAQRYPDQLSGGQQQRVALARALAIAPEALLLDEPLSALDTYLRSQIERLLGEVLSNYEGITLFVTHKLEEAYRICPHLLVLSQGKAIAYGPKQDIFERPPNFQVAQVTECKNFSRARRITSQQIEALDWNCTLRVLEPIPEPLTYIGIRAHHLLFTENIEENTFPCWLVHTSETQHRITLYLKLHAPPTAQEYHLQVEIYKEKWAELKVQPEKAPAAALSLLKERPSPWLIQLHPLRLMLLSQ